jgi:hypothetical protein
VAIPSSDTICTSLRNIGIFRVQCDVGHLESTKHLEQVFGLFLEIPVNLGHVINVYQVCFVSKISQDGFHQAIETCYSFAKARGHKCEASQSMSSRKGCLILVVVVPGYLKLATLYIQGQRKLAPASVSRMSSILGSRKQSFFVIPFSCHSTHRTNNCVAPSLPVVPSCFSESRIPRYAWLA